MNKIQIEMESYASQSCLYDERSGRADSVDGIRRKRERERLHVYMSVYHIKKLGLYAAITFSTSVPDENLAIGYRFRLVPIIVVKNKERGRIADSPKFMTYIAWDRSSRCACSTAR